MEKEILYKILHTIILKYKNHMQDLFNPYMENKDSIIRQVNKSLLKVNSEKLSNYEI